MDWLQIIEIATTPDNIPILIMMVLVPVYTFMAFKQAFANDRLIRKLEADPKLAKTHHRTVYPYKKEWPRLVHVWPYLLKRELLATIIVLSILIVWSVVLQAPLEEPANPNLTMNPSKAPWYFLGLQEMLVYFDPWIAGVVMPGLIIVGLMAIPYCDVSPLGNGYYTYAQRKYAIWTFLFGFIVLWLSMVFIGVFIRGPGWMWFWPGMTWDHHRVLHEVNINLHQFIGVPEYPKTQMEFLTGGLFGFGVISLYFLIGHVIMHKLYTKLKPEAYAKMNIWQYATMHIFMLLMISLPIKMFLRLAFHIKYVMVTPWFSI